MKKEKDLTNKQVKMFWLKYGNKLNKYKIKSSLIRKIK